MVRCHRNVFWLAKHAYGRLFDIPFEHIWSSIVIVLAMQNDFILIKSKCQAKVLWQINLAAYMWLNWLDLFAIISIVANGWKGKEIDDWSIILKYNHPLECTFD